MQGRPTIYAALNGAIVTDPQRASAERRFLEALRSQLGGDAGAREGYERWLRAGAAPAPLTVEDLTAKIRWESAFEMATWRALGECDWETGSAFFVVHLRDPRGR